MFSSLFNPNLFWKPLEAGTGFEFPRQFAMLTDCILFIPRRCKTSSVGQRRIVNPEVVGSSPAKTQKTENSNLHGFELHRPSSKGTKSQLQVIKANIDRYGSGVRCLEITENAVLKWTHPCPYKEEEVLIIVASDVVKVMCEGYATPGGATSPSPGLRFDRGRVEEHVQGTCSSTRPLSKQQARDSSESIHQYNATHARSRCLRTSSFAHPLLIVFRTPLFHIDFRHS